MLEELLGNTEIVTTLLALGPVGYIIMALLTAAGIYMAWMAKKNAHKKAVKDATTSTSEETRESQERLKDTNSAGDTFLDS